MSKAWPVTDLDPNAPLDINARRILRTRVGEFYSYEPVVGDPLAVQPLHDLRIAAKRLRYSLELFPDTFGEAGKQQIDRIKAIQEALGNLHDIDVRIELICSELIDLHKEQLDQLHHALASSDPSTYDALTTSLLRPPPDAPQRGLVALLSRQHAERQQTYREFKALWDRFDLEGMRNDLTRLSSVHVVWS